MQLSTINLSLTRAYGGGSPAWSPISLFASGEVGAWYDPYDLSTMFQDRSGTTPVTADGQPVGLILDKSKGLALGAELAVNGDFNSGTGWTLGAGWTVSGGKLNASTTQYTRAWYNVAAGAFVTGKTYKIEFDVSGYVAGTFLAFLSDSGGAKEGQCYFISTGNGHKICYIRATSTVSGFGFEDESGSPPNFSIDNASVKELPGNHATAPSDAARPLYKTDGTYHWLQFDGVDDTLSTAGSIGINSPPLSTTFGISSTAVENNQSCFSTSKYISGINTSKIKFTTVGILDYYASTPTPINNTPYVLSEIFDLGFDCTFRINASNEQLVAGSSDSGAGSASLLIGSHSGITFLSGKLYSLIIRGALSTADEIAATETWVNQRTGAY